MNVLKCIGSGYLACMGRVPACPCPVLPARFQPYICKHGGCYQGSFPLCIQGQWICD